MSELVTVWLYPLPGARPDRLDAWRASSEHPGLFGSVAAEGAVPREVWEAYDHARRYGRRRDDHPSPEETLGVLADAMFANPDGVLYRGERLIFERVAADG
jgi:hypothetical protein